MDDIKQIIYEKFKKYTFHEDSHTYTYLDSEGNEQTIGISTTQFIHSFTEPFDEDGMSKIVARKKHTTQEAVLKEWAFNRELACDYGTLAHLYLECLWMNYPFLYDEKPFIEKFGYDPVTPKFEAIKPALQKFYDTFKDRLELIGAEVVIASEDYDIAGSIDLLAYSKKLNAIVIIDNKSNKEIKKKGYNGQTMKYPLNHLQDSNFWHYSLQGAIYKRILEYETGIKVSEKKFLIWFDSKKLDYKIIECENLDKEAFEILEKRKNDRENCKTSL
jgi:hypothetical protein